MIEFKLGMRIKDLNGKEGEVTYLYTTDPTGLRSLNVRFSGEAVDSYINDPQNALRPIEATQPTADTQPGNTEFFRSCVKSLLKVAKKKKFLTADDLWKEIGTGTATGRKQAMGTFMASAATAGILQGTKRYRRSARTAGPLKVWKSLVFNT